METLNLLETEYDLDNIQTHVSSRMVQERPQMRKIIRFLYADYDDFSSALADVKGKCGSFTDLERQILEAYYGYYSSRNSSEQELKVYSYILGMHDDREDAEEALESLRQNEDLEHFEFPLKFNTLIEKIALIV